MLSNDQITQYFEAIVRRAPTSAELTQYGALDTEAAAIDAITQDLGADTIRAVQFYQVYYNRLPDPAGLDFWTMVIRDNPNLSDAQLAGFFFEAGEFDVIYGQLSTADAVRLLYENVLGREADDAGFNFWFGQVQADNGFGLDDLGLAFATAPETVATFTPLAEAYLGALAAGEAARATIFDYAADAAKPELETDFTGSDEKVGIPEPVFNTEELASIDIAGIETLNTQAASLMNLDDFRADPRFSDIDGQGFTVAVLDTGIDIDHPAFGAAPNGVSERIVAAVDFTNEGDFTPDDVQGHGSHVTSIIASENPQFLGVAPAVDIAGLQVLNANGSGISAWTEQALQWVIENAAAENIIAVNMSLGTQTNISVAQPFPDGYADELAQLNAMGITVIAAAGNSYESFQTPGTSTLAADPNTIAVGALWDEDINPGTGLKNFSALAGDIASFSQRAPDPSIDTIFAPGAIIVGAAPGGGRTTSLGTSQAAPQVTGLVVLAQDIARTYLDRALTPAEVEFVIRQGANTIVDSEIPRDGVINTGASYDSVDALGMAEAILALAGGSITPPDPTPADAIPGDASTSRNIVFGNPVQNQIDTAFDTDWFAVTFQPGATYRITLEGAASGVGTLADPLVNVVDAEGRVIASDDDGGLGLEADLLYTSAAGGQVFVEARAYSDQTGTYRLNVELIDPGAAFDDLPAGPGTSAVIIPGIPAAGALDSEGDHDWFALDVVAGRRYEIALAGADSGNGTLADPVLRIFDNTGTLVVVNDDADQRDSLATIEALANTRIFIDAGGFNDAFTGTYTVFVDEIADLEIPDGPGTSTSLPVDGAAVSQLDYFGDEDWYAVTLTRGVLYEIAVAGAASGAFELEDPLVQVYDAAGNPIAFDDDTGPGLDPFLEFRPLDSGTYFIGVGAFGGNYTGTYEVSLASGSATDLAEDPTTAGVLGVGTVASGVLEEIGDRDWYAADLVAGVTYTATLQGAGSGSGTLPDPILGLFNGAGVFQLEDDDSLGGLESELVFTVDTTGTYFLEAAAYFDETAGTYALTLTTEDGGGGGDLPAGPGTTASVVRGEAFASAIDEPGDQDWIAVVLFAGIDYRFDARGAQSGNGTIADPRLQLFNDGGLEVAFNDDRASGVLDSTILFTPDTDGTYYLGVSGFEANTGTYTLTTASAEGTIAPGQSLTGLIDFEGDDDWYAAELFAGSTYAVFLEGEDSGLGTLIDPFLEVRDIFGDVVATNDDASDDTFDSFLTFTPSEDGIYFLTAQALDGSEFDVDYVLTLV